MKLEAKQFAFMLAGVVLGAIVLFVVGMEVGRRVDLGPLDEAAAFAEANVPAATATSSLANGTTDAPEYSFFNDLDAPAAPLAVRKLRRSERNANNSPEIEAKLAKQRERKKKRAERKLARERARGEFKGPDGRVAVIKRLTRRDGRAERSEAKDTSPVVAEAPMARTLLANPDARGSVGSAPANARAISRRAPDVAVVDSGYTLQLGVYRTETDASALMHKLRSQGHAAQVTRSAVPGKGEIYRVRVGQFRSIESADRVRSRINASGHTALVTPL